MPDLRSPVNYFYSNFCYIIFCFKFYVYYKLMEFFVEYYTRIHIWNIQSKKISLLILQRREKQFKSNELFEVEA